MTERRRTTLRIERTPEERAELRAEREPFARERPDAEELLATGDHESRYRQGQIIMLLSVIAEPRRLRAEQGLSLAEVSERSSFDRAMLSRLENGKILNPTMATLWHYSEAIGSQVTMGVQPLAV